MFHLDGIGVSVPHVFIHELHSGLPQLVLHPRVELGKDGIIFHEFELKIGDVTFEISFLQVQGGTDHAVRLHLMQKKSRIKFKLGLKNSN